MPGPAEQSAVAAVAVLADAVRGQLYRYVRRHEAPVTREEAADAVGISRALAAFHLDKMVVAGVLRARYDRVAGARRLGRTPKVYEPSDEEFAVTVPMRRYDLLGDLLLAGLADAEPDGAEAVYARALDAARAYGRALGARAREGLRGGRLGVERGARTAEVVLDELGFEPARNAESLVLRNCPFDRQAREHTTAVCGLNLALVGGLLEGIDAPGLEARLTPSPGSCCVAVAPVPVPSPH
jgi:predicted ArsR family transcriptional regulator